ncbi:SusC/RagA family TonB-linked outer membrane protein [Xanthocytophaga flava]|uniref:SusC/RagA family TonB-linked outer membrane protein n=1 Tax=Xanthocytophaga flava TaxID=3048013 RepID=UPI0028D31B33|nr:SusC/RagA family TonB-linked outer membrane protein [Xanthocytophaga flavus]MDJ1466878.1 SusC/RagA family TonB-linked outer membrane protein [Xanthocytophaga flavus]
MLQFSTHPRYHLLRCSWFGCFLGFGLLTTHAQIASSAPLRKYSQSSITLQGNTSLQESTITLQVSNEKLSSVFDRIEKQSHFVFVYSNDEINTTQRISLHVQQKQLNEVLNELSGKFGFTFEILKDKIILKGNAESKASDQAHTILPGEMLNSLEARLNATRSQFADITITGKVISENGEGMPGVSVSIKGTTIGASTTVDGSYTLKVPDSQANGVLVFSFIGYVSEEVAISGRTKIDITLLPDIQSLSEVVVVGYGTQQRKDLTSSVATLGKTDIESRPTTNAYQAMQGLAANVTIQQNTAEPGAVPVFNIRGVGSFSSNNEPLIIIDGLIAGSLGMANLNPNDIENITILKDASSAAIYGSQAGSGVVLITTKKGKTDQKPTVRYSTLIGWQNPTTLPKAVEGWEFMTLKNEALINSSLSPQFSPQQIQEQREKGSYPWMLDEEFRKNAPQIKHDLSVSGGGKNTTYMASFGYLDQDNMLNNKYVRDAGNEFYYKRYNARLNLTTQINKMLSVTVNTAYAKASTRSTPFSMGNIIRDALRTPRIYPLVNEDGTFPTTASFSNNNLALLSQGGFNLMETDNLVGTLDATLTPLEGLRFNMNMSGNFFQYNQQTQIRAFTYSSPYPSDPPRNNEQVKQAWRDYNTNIYFTGQYEKQIGKHSAKVLAGYRSDYSSSTSFNYEGKFYPELYSRQLNGVPLNSSLVLQGDFLRNAQGQIQGGITDYARMANPQLGVLNSVFGRLNYGYGDRYLFEFTWRYDGSSKLAPQSRWLFYPAASVAWRLTSEPFMGDIADRFGTVKIRASYGKVGNSGIGGYLFIPRISPVSGAYTFNNVSVGGVNIQPFNPELRWASVTNANIGADFELLKNSLTVSLDYFRSINEGNYYAPVVPGTFGQSSPVQNFATVLNRGWEIAATYNLVTGPVKHSFSANLADNFNTIQKLGTDEINEADSRTIQRERFPISSYYMYKNDGLFQTYEQIQNSALQPFAQNGQPQPGDIKFVDKNGDGVIDANDRFIMGNPFPRYTYGFTYRASYKGIDLTIFLQGVGQRSQYLRGDAVEAFHNNEEHLYVQHKDRWTPTNPGATYPRLTATVGANSNNVVYSDYWLYDTRYLRVKNLQVGYSFPKEWLDKVSIGSARIYVSGQNLLTWVPQRFRRLGIDPEFTQFGNNLSYPIANYSAIAGRSYPNSRVVAIGLDVSF